MLNRTRIALLIAFATTAVACLDQSTTEPAPRAEPARKAEDKVTSIEVENKTGDSAVVLVKYKQGDANPITIHASMQKDGGVQIIDGAGTVQLVEIKIGGGDAGRYKVEDGGVITRDGLKIRKLKIVKKDGFAPFLTASDDTCGPIVSGTPTDEEGEAVEIVPGVAGCDCFGCPDAPDSAPTI